MQRSPVAVRHRPLVETMTDEELRLERHSLANEVQPMMARLQLIDLERQARAGAQERSELDPVSPLFPPSRPPRFELLTATEVSP